MTHPIYRLSNAQRKKLFIRKTALCIAIPLDSRQWRECVRDALGWAAKFLPDVDETIQSAEEGIIDVLRPFRSTGEPKTLSDALGHIATEADATNEWHQIVRMSVLIVWLSHGDSRHQAARPQWPADVVIDGTAVFGNQNKEEK